MVDIEELAEAIEDHGAQFGMKSKRISSTARQIVIRSVQTRPWYDVLLWALPQDIEWVLSQTGEGASVRYDSRLFRWCRVTVLGLSFVMVLLVVLLQRSMSVYGAQFSSDEPEIGWSWFVGLCTVVALGTLLVFTFRFLCAGDGPSFRQYWESVRLAVEEEHEVLEHLGGWRNLLRSSIPQLGYLGFSLGLVAGLIILDATDSSSTATPPNSTPRWVWGLVAILGAITLSLLAIIVHLARERFDRRFATVLPGLACMGALAFFPAGLVGFFYVGSPEMQGEKLEVLRDFQLDPAMCVRKAEQPGEMARAIESGMMEKGVGLVRAWLVISAGSMALVLMGCAVLALHAVRVAGEIRPYLFRLAARSAEGESRLAVLGKGVLGRFRFAVGLVWLGVGGLVLLSVVNFSAILVNTLTRATLRTYPSAIGRAVDVSISMATIAAGRASDDVLMGFAVRLCWVVYVSLFLIAFAVSVGSLLGSRLRRRARLWRDCAARRPCAERAVRVLEEICRKRGIRCPRVAVFEEEGTAMAYRFGVLRTTEWISVSSHLLRRFDGPEDDAPLGAILAHELAHLKSAHCLLDDVMRLLGRMTFVGDGFVRALQDSFGYEAKADRIAVEEYGIDPTAFLAALTRLRQAEAAKAGLTRRLSDGLGATSSGDVQYTRYLKEGPRGLPLVARWKLALRAFYEYYFGAVNVAYWHPSWDERIVRMQGMAKELSKGKVTS